MAQSSMETKVSRLVIAGLAGDSGKTLITLSLLAALRKKALSISVFKKGPDYIDAAWLSFISGGSCRNLDTYLTDPTEVLNSFVGNAIDTDIAVIEGNRGLYDGKDIFGTHSTAQLAKLLKASIILVVNCTKSTRTIAAIIKGCQTFDTDVTIAGVVLNNIAGKRHQKIITDSIEKFCDLPVLGAIPKLGKDAKLIPGRHLGLIPPSEFSTTTKLTNKFEEIANNYLNIEKLLSLAKNDNSLVTQKASPLSKEKAVRIGYFRDSVFTFYYPENLEALKNEGAELVPISSLEDKKLPKIDGLYIGGGFPETFARQLTKNNDMMDSVKSSAHTGLPIYAECGGLIYLCKSIKWEENRYEMAGVFPTNLVMYKKPVGHGYSEMEIDKQNPFFEIGESIKGHEFHYSGISDDTDIGDTSAKMITGIGLGNKRDGLVFKNTMACYTHIHASGVKSWAESMIKAAKLFKNDRGNSAGNFSGSKRSKKVAA
ncbi:MAG: hydrogenobyrinic acid a,c-diamide synthase (glutamine-hydrolyzing) [candidate division Zixibacteria bacterium]|nr:hydrogenobyrinic acid a,c-diamide synthase (glutamine-hydrolyzing) [candidate division Zixibacteria bacterium]